jgi:hypothetical protein
MSFPAKGIGIFDRRKPARTEALALSIKFNGSWMPDQVRHDYSRIFYETINFDQLFIEIL